MPHPEEYRTPHSVAAERLRLIAQRLQDHYYEVPPAAEQIAACVLADLKNLERDPSALPH